MKDRITKVQEKEDFVEYFKILSQNLTPGRTEENHKKNLGYDNRPPGLEYEAEADVILSITGVSNIFHKIRDVLGCDAM
jgi:hypothetical protein